MTHDNRAYGHVILLRVEADTFEQTVASFELAAAEMKTDAYKSSYGRFGVDIPYVSVRVELPRPAALTDLEIEKVRDLIAGQVP